MVEFRHYTICAIFFSHAQSKMAFDIDVLVTSSKLVKKLIHFNFYH